jgi:hypothetical protein
MTLFYGSDDRRPLVTRTQTTFMIDKDHRSDDGPIATILIDRTTPGDEAVWNGRANCEPMPGMKESSSESKCSANLGSWYNDICLASTQHKHEFSANPSDNIGIMPLPAIHIISAEWMLAYVFVKARLKSLDYSNVPPSNGEAREFYVQAMLEGVEV